MTVIPARRLARTTWAELPEATRRQALYSAAKGEAAADPVVAAIIAGALRDRSLHPSWERRAAWYLPLAALVGAAVALQYFGILSLERITTITAIASAAVFGTIFLVGVAAELPRRVRRWLRHEPAPEDLSTDAIAEYAELPNIRKVLATAPARIAAPLIVHGHPRVRRTLLFLALSAVMAVGFVALLDRVQDESGDIHRLLHVHFSIFLGAAALAGWASWGRHLRHLPLRIDQSGLRFGLTQRIAWSDVLGVELMGPTPAFPETKPVLVWTLRTGSSVSIEFDAVTTAPEEIILAARAYWPSGSTGDFADSGGVDAP